MALDPGALITLEDARLYVKRKLNDDSADPILETLINEATVAIRNHTHRQFNLQDEAADVAKKFRYDGTGLLPFAQLNTELAELTSIVLYTDLEEYQQEELTADYYRLEPRNKTEEDTWLELALPELRYGTLFGHEVTVTGKWGTTVVPRPVERACKITVDTWWSQRVGQTSGASLGEVAFQDFVSAHKDDPLPRAAVLLLDDGYTQKLLG
jgi:hypothetical protein